MGRWIILGWLKQADVWDWNKRQFRVSRAQNSIEDSLHQGCIPSNRGKAGDVSTTHLREVTEKDVLRSEHESGCICKKPLWMLLLSCLSLNKKIKKLIFKKAPEKWALSSNKLFFVNELLSGYLPILDSAWKVSCWSGKRIFFDFELVILIWWRLTKDVKTNYFYHTESRTQVTAIFAVPDPSTATFTLISRKQKYLNPTFRRYTRFKMPQSSKTKPVWSPWTAAHERRCWGRREYGLSTEFNPKPRFCSDNWTTSPLLCSPC